MINSKSDLRHYINCDLKSLQCYPVTVKMRVNSWMCPAIWKYQVRLRKLEFLKNCRCRNPIEKLIFKIKMIRYEKYGLKLGFSIPLNVFDSGLCLCHAGTVIVNQYCKIGKNARIHANVNIGNCSRFGKDWTPDNVPEIGDNIYIGPGAKIFGKIVIGNDVAIGANSVVNKDIDDHVTIAGIPAKVINNKGSEGLIIYGS